MIQQTSQLSLLETIAEGKINKRQQQILDCFNEIENIYGAKILLNNRQISDRTKIPINVVTPRVNELRKLGKLIEAKKERDPATNRLTIFWKLK